MAKKASKNTREIGVLSKNRSWEDFVDGVSLLSNPTDPNWRKTLIRTMMTWAGEEDSLELQQFLSTYKIPYMTFTEWRNKYPDIRKALNEIKIILGSRRRIGCLKRIYDREAVFKDMHLYEPDWHKEVNQYWSDLKEREAAAGKQTFTIEMAPARVTGKIKPKKEKE